MHNLNNVNGDTLARLACPSEHADKRKDALPRSLTLHAIITA